MANQRILQFIRDVQNTVTQFLQGADGWSNYAEEYKALTANGTLPTQNDINDIYGFQRDEVTPNVTLQQWTDALLAQQAIVDSLHVAATRNKLYRIRK